MSENLRSEQNTPELPPYYYKERDSLLNSVIRMAILFIIRDYEQEGIHGYGIGEILASKTKGIIDSSNAVYYAILRQMRDSSGGKIPVIEQYGEGMRKYYRLTEEGRKTCDNLWQYWQHYFNLLKELNFQS